MTLKRFSLVLLSSLLLTITMLLLSIYYFFYLPGIKSEVLDQQQQEFNLLHSALSLSKNSLTTLCYDYAVWDELVEYISNPTDDFVQSNLPDNAFEAANIDAVFVIDTNNKLIWDYQDDSLKSSRASLVHLFNQQNTESFAILPTADEIASQTVSSRSGYLVFDGAIIYFSNTTILPSTGYGEIAGSLTMVRLVDKALIKDISRFSLVKFSIEDVQTSTKNTQEFFSLQQIETIAPSHSWLIRNTFDDQVVQVTLHHKKVSLPKADWVSVISILLSIGLIFSLSLMALSRLLIKPLIHFNKSINDSSDDNFISKMASNHFIDEIENVSYSFNQLLLKFNAQQNYLETLTVQDSLTGITNRRGLEAFSKRIISRWHLENVGFSVMMIDVDNFKYFNDQQGHLKGDDALITVATCLVEVMAQYDALAARYGGEEFCIILPDNHHQNILKVAEDIRESIEELQISNNIDDRKWLTVSIGVVVVDDKLANIGKYNFSDVLQYADEQLYLAKQAGRNTVRVAKFGD
ncbi:diguanylate cyclase [Shewanella livingstonensis]|uniref:diguanylate cyclase n=1 Tax=Shewanella livingstonensis TaxID=150120 RepID=A0A3G8LPU3_9GAMM|nr:diguanylate cyclase [Shewanella livingstonensis]AZG71407.1 diguanylate cyclase [Shewanella livingstonensis]